MGDSEGCFGGGVAGDVRDGLDLDVQLEAMTRATQDRRNLTRWVRLRRLDFWRWLRHVELGEPATIPVRAHKNNPLIPTQWRYII